MTHEIETDVPMPKSRPRYPWADMKVGDSFSAEVTHTQLGVTARGWAKRHGKPWKFLVRPKENGGARIWRSE